MSDTTLRIGTQGNHLFTHLKHQININSEFFNNITFSKLQFLKALKKTESCKNTLKYNLV